MRIKNLEIDPVRYYYKVIYTGNDHGVYYYDDHDQKTTLRYPVELDTKQDREHFLYRLNDDYQMYLHELLFYLIKMKK